MKSKRRPLLGGLYVNKALKMKVIDLVKRNKERLSSLESTSRNYQDVTDIMPSLTLPSLHKNIEGSSTLLGSKIRSERNLSRNRAPHIKLRMNTDVSKLIALSKADCPIDELSY